MNTPTPKLQFPTKAERALSMFRNADELASLTFIAMHLFKAERTKQGAVTTYIFDDDSSLVVSGRGKMEAMLPMTRIPINPSITIRRLEEAVMRRHTSLYDPGFCTACGHEQGGCEPDARDIQCESCGLFSVVGSDDLLEELR